MKKYEIHNQITGLNEEAFTFEEALELQKKLRLEFCQQRNISELSIMELQNDGSWLQYRCDESGNSIIEIQGTTNFTIL